MFHHRQDEIGVGILAHGDDKFRWSIGRHRNPKAQQAVASLFALSRSLLELCLVWSEMEKGKAAITFGQIAPSTQ